MSFLNFQAVVDAMLAEERAKMSPEDLARRALHWLASQNTRLGKNYGACSYDPVAVLKAAPWLKEVGPCLNHAVLTLVCERCGKHVNICHLHIPVWFNHVRDCEE